MEIAAQLSDLRSAIPGCHVAAFVDLSTRMVLAHDTRSKVPQERLDGLADRAVALLDTPITGDVPPDHAIAISADNQEVFLRAVPKSSDGLCLVCGHDTDAQAATKAGLTLLRGMV